MSPEFTVTTLNLSSDSTRFVSVTREMVWWDLRPQAWFDPITRTVNSGPLSKGS